ncbi:MAG TPA: polyprenyl synthetase family protein [Acholeplasmataceae bacterium]|jgi:geranylgeranyl diphosphate synthase type II|nr:polyprenyl synthetase family protein [Acholeplasmataceae bacterium]
MIEKLTNLIDNKLREILSNYQVLNESLEYGLFPGGKRFRPLLLLTILEDLQVDVNLGLEIACAIEMIHTYSLIHDDLPAMDNDDMRRGKPSMHIAFSENIAILTGDALLTESFYWITKSNISDEKKVRIINLISKYVGAHGMIKGQVLDINSKEYTLDKILEIHQHKTVDLIACSILSAAIISDDEDNIWYEIASALGKAFQIKDDLDDADKLDEANIIHAVGMQRAQDLFYEYRIKCLKMISEKLGKGNTYNLVEMVL